MLFTPTFISGLFTIDLNVIEDNRGWFARTFCKEEFTNVGLEGDWAQMNHSCTRKKSALRGMHFQNPPFCEIKLIRCVAGSVFDVAIDLRASSSTFLKWFGVKLSAANKKMIYIPRGFAHGFVTLEDNCEMIYHHSSYYKPTSEGGIKFDDPLVNINWPIPILEISDRDKNHSYLAKNFKGINL